MTFADEGKLINDLPKYVASSPDSMPSARLYEGDMNSLLLLLRSLDTRMTGVESMIATIASQVHASQQGLKPPDPACQHHLVQQPGQQSHNKHVHGRQPAISGAVGESALSISSVQHVSSLPSDHTTNSMTSHHPVEIESETETRWAMAASTPVIHANRYAALGSTTDDDQQSFTTVLTKRGKRLRRRSSPTQDTLMSNQQQRSEHVRRGPLLVGKSTSDKNISAAKRLVKKTVLCVDNVKNTCSVNDMHYCLH